MMAVAAVDRLVHHALIVEIQSESYRKQAAAARAAETQLAISSLEQQADAIWTAISLRLVVTI